MTVKICPQVYQVEEMVCPTHMIAVFIWWKQKMIWP